MIGNSKIKQVLLMGCVCSTLFVGCESDDDFDVALGGDDERVLTTLTETETQDVCERFVASSDNDDALVFACYTLAVFSSGVDESVDCEEVAMNCIASPEDSETTDCSDTSINIIPENCTATVGELEACLRDFEENDATLADGLTCENFEMRTENAPEEPASCMVLNQKCPGLISEAE